MLIVYLLLSLGSDKLDPGWVSYKPLTSLQTTEIDGVGYFVSDFDEKQVRHYDRDWKLVRLLGGPGEGPGEMTHPMHLLSLPDRLCVRDGARVHLFDTEGRFQKTLRIPGFSAFSHVHLVADGWVVLRTNYAQTRVSLAHYDPDFRNPILITEWLSDAHTAPNPFRGTSFTSQIRNSASILIKPEQEDTIWIYDAEHRTLRTLEIAVRPVPISEKQKREIVEAYNQKRRSDTVQSITMNDVPDHYPLFSRMSSTVTGKVKLSRRIDDLDRPDGYRRFHEEGFDLYVDLSGDPLEPEIADYVPQMVIDQDDRFIYHTGYDAEEDGFMLYRTAKTAFLETAYTMQQAYSRNWCATCR